MKKYLHMCKICSIFAAFLDKGVYFTLIVNMILNHLLTYNLLMTSAAAYVCMYVCMYVCTCCWTGSQEVANQADQPTNKRQVLRALVALSYINNKLTNILTKII